MNIPAIYHEAKSKYAYSVDKETLHLRIRTAKKDADKVTIVYGDPFNWSQRFIHESKEMIKDYTTDFHDYYFAEVKPPYRRCKYVFILEKDGERIIFGSHSVENLNEKPEKEFDLFNFFNFPYINETDIFYVPDWVKKTIWYQIFPERFANGDKSNDRENTLPWGSVENVRNDMFFGGDLQGVTDHIDYLKALGISGIYFTPIFESPSTHKYDTIDYFKIDKQFGNNDIFRQLVNIAHKNNIRIMLDGVFNHCGYYHPFFQDVIKNQEESIYKDYFHIRKFPVIEGDVRQFRFKQGESELNFDTFAFTPFMPKWNTDNPEVRKYLISVGTYWVKEYDIDGWRLDVSNEVDHEFWREFRKEVSKVKKDIYIIGENWDESTPWLRGEQFTSVMNYNFTYPCWNYFGKRISNAIQFKTDINKLLVTYPKNVLTGMFNLLDSHDTERILSLCGENKAVVKLAYLFLMTFTGTPSIYYGGEIGLSGKHDPENRRCMIWDINMQDRNLYIFIERLIQIRKEYISLRNGDFVFLEANSRTNHIIYKKQFNDETIYIIINNSDKHIRVTMPKEMSEQNLYDIFNNEEIKSGKRLSLKPFDFMIYKRI